MDRFAVGIDLGGTMMKAALVERDHGLRHHIAIDTHADKGPDHVLGRIQQAIEMMMKEAPDSTIAGVGIGVPGSVDWERSSVHYPANLPGWEVVNLRTTLQERLGLDLPVIVENDANVAGLGSAHYSVGRPHDSFIMITLGTGVGGAIIYQNTIFRGMTGAAGEIGHMSIDYEGPYDRAGVAGSIEAYIGQRFLSRHARYQLLTREQSTIHKLAGDELENITPKMLYDAAEQGDEAAKEVFVWAGHKLGVVLGSAINLLDIRKVIVGGGMSGAGDYILDPARRTVKRYVMPALRHDVEILRETLGNEVGMLGAAHLVFEYLDAHGSTSEQQ